MKNMSVVFKIPAIFIMISDKTMLVPSAILSTLSICLLTTFIPQLTPLWMQLSTASTK